MRLLAPFIVIVAALVLTVQLDDTPAEADLVFVNRGDVFTLDPQRQSYLQDFRMTYALFEGLVRWDNDDFSVLPAAADLPELSADRRRYTFRLRSDARWSNGEPVTAHDFRYSWMRLLLPDTAADYSNLIFCIEGAEPFWSWRSAQLAAFAANPWDAGAGRRRAQTDAMLRRLRALLRDKPRGVDLAGIDEAALEAEWSALEAAGDDALAAALEDARATRDLHRGLGSTDSRSAEAEWMWRAVVDRFDATVGIKAVGDRTLEVTLERPTAYFLDLVCFGVCSPVHRPCVEGWPDHGPDPARAERGWAGVEPPPLERCRWVALDPSSGRFEQKHLWARPGRMVGNGPYILGEWRYKRDMRLERNPFYHSPEMARSDTVVALTIEDTNTRVMAFEIGKVHWLAEVGAEYQADMVEELRRYLDRHADRLAELLASGLTRDEALDALPPPGPGERRNVRVLPAFGTDFYSYNCRPTLSDGRPNPFADAAVRRAFTMAVDKRAIVDRVTRLGEPVATTLIPPGSIKGYRSPAGLPHDVAAARRELEQAGWADRDGNGLIENPLGEPFPVIDLLWTTNTPRYKWISLELKAQWEQALGVRVALRGTDTKFYKEDLKQGKFMIGRGRWYGDYGDPTTFLDLCRSTDGNNDRGYDSPEYDAMLDAAAEEPDPRKRLAMLSECERFIMEEEVPMLVICQLVEVYMLEPGVLRGFTDHPRLTQYLWKMEVAKP